MKKFILATFKITWFQLLLVVIFSTFKYFMAAYKIDAKIQLPFVWACLGVGLVFIITVGIMGIIDIRSGSYKAWEQKAQKTTLEKVLLFICKWGFAVPVIAACVLFLYMIAPTSWSMGIVLYISIAIRNGIDFFSKKEVVPAE